MQPPWSTATSTTTEPFSISRMSSSVTSFGALRARDEHRADDEVGLARPRCSMFSGFE